MANTILMRPGTTHVQMCSDCLSTRPQGLQSLSLQIRRLENMRNRAVWCGSWILLPIVASDFLSCLDVVITTHALHKQIAADMLSRITGPVDDPRCDCQGLAWVQPFRPRGIANVHCDLSFQAVKAVGYLRMMVPRVCVAREQDVFHHPDIWGLQDDSSLHVPGRRFLMCLAHSSPSCMLVSWKFL